MKMALKNNIMACEILFYNGLDRDQAAQDIQKFYGIHKNIRTLLKTERKNMRRCC